MNVVAMSEVDRAGDRMGQARTGEVRSRDM